MKKQFKLVKDKNSFQIHWDKKSINELQDESGNKYLEIEGYASTKDKDRGCDIVEPKAFENALATYMTNPVVLLQHKHDKPIGVVTDATIDDKGLYIKANITENTDGVMSAIKNGVLRTFSIGYGIKEGDYVVEEKIDENGRYDYTTTIKNLELYEISVVSVPMNAYALMKSIEDCFEVKEVEEEIEGTSIDGVPEIVHGDEEIEETENTEQEVEDNESHEEVEETLSGNIEIEQKEVEKSVENDEELVEKNVEDEENIETTDEENEESEEEVVEEENTKEEEKVEEIEAEEKEVAENANIEETEVEEVSENEVETPTDDGKVDETSNEEVVETKSMEESSEKSFKIDEKAIEERLEKKFEAKLVEQTKKVEDLTKDLEQTKAVLKMAIGVIKEMDGAVRNTVIKTGATYSKVAKKKSARGDVISLAQNSI